MPGSSSMISALDGERRIVIASSGGRRGQSRLLVPFAAMGDEQGRVSAHARPPITSAMSAFWMCSRFSACL